MKGIRDPAIVFAAVLVFGGAGSRIAARPELLDELYALGIRLELHERGHQADKIDQITFAEEAQGAGINFRAEFVGGKDLTAYLDDHGFFRVDLDKRLAIPHDVNNGRIYPPRPWLAFHGATTRKAGRAHAQS